MQDFRNLTIWHKAHELTLDIYCLTREYPRTETYGLVSQMRRSASSIPTNIAEGCGRYSNKELARFIQIAMGSCSELEYQVLLSRDLKYLSIENYNQVMPKVIILKKMIASFLKGLRKQLV